MGSVRVQYQGGTQVNRARKTTRLLRLGETHFFKELKPGHAAPG